LRQIKRRDHERFQAEGARVPARHDWSARSNGVFFNSRPSSPNAWAADAWAPVEDTPQRLALNAEPINSDLDRTRHGELCAEPAQSRGACLPPCSVATVDVGQGERRSADAGELVARHHVEDAATANGALAHDPAGRGLADPADDSYGLADAEPA
jgi:hypothetical protein